jgi:VanZ family protein
MSLRSPLFASNGYAAVAFGFALFTIYGSLIPFDYVPRSLTDANEAYRWVWMHRVWPQSRADFLANAVLGFPLGYSLIAAVRTGLPGLRSSVVWTCGLLSICTAFAAAIEFVQLWFPTRSSAASDVIAQVLGALLGMAVWMMTGEWLTGRLRTAWNSPHYGGRNARALCAMVLTALAIQTLPWDFTASPHDWMRKVRGGITYVPFQDWTDPSHRVQIQWDALESIVLYVPIGAMAFITGGWFRRFGNAALAGLALGVFVEACQWPVMSRHPSTTDIVRDALAFIAGWSAARTVSVQRMPMAVPIVVWIGFLTAVSWWPYAFGVTPRHTLFSLEHADPLFWLGEMAVKLLAFAPLGAVCGPRGIVWAGAASFVLEFGQTFVPGRFGSVADFVLAVGGGVAGVAFARRFGSGWTGTTEIG